MLFFVFFRRDPRRKPWVHPRAYFSAYLTPKSMHFDPFLGGLRHSEAFRNPFVYNDLKHFAT